MSTQAKPFPSTPADLNTAHNPRTQRPAGQIHLVHYTTSLKYNSRYRVKTSPAAAAPPINHAFRHLLGFQMLSSLSRCVVAVSSTRIMSPPRFPRRARGVAANRSAADGFRGSITWYFRRTNRRFFSPFPSKKSTLSGSSSSL